MANETPCSLLVTPSTAMICGCCPVASGTVSIGMLNVVTRRRCRWKHYTLFVNDVFSLVLLKPASRRLRAHINLQQVVPQSFVSTGNKADMKSIQRPTTFKTNCFYEQTANEYFKIINPSLSVALEGFSGVFISTSAVLLQHFWKTKKTVFSIGTDRKKKPNSSRILRRASWQAQI